MVSWKLALCHHTNCNPKRCYTYKCSVTCVRVCLEGLLWVYKYYSRVSRIGVGLCKGPLHVQRGKKSELKGLCLYAYLAQFKW